MIVSLAAAGHLAFAEPCVAGCTAATGITYDALAPGGACQCGTGNPLPVAQVCAVPPLPPPPACVSAAQATRSPPHGTSIQ